MYVLSRNLKNIRFFLYENFQFLEVKFSIYLNRRVFVMVRLICAQLGKLQCLLTTTRQHFYPKFFGLVLLTKSKFRLLQQNMYNYQCVDAAAIRIKIIKKMSRKCYHYENTPIQIYWKFITIKNENFQIKKSDIFHISAQNIDCG